MVNCLELRFSKDSGSCLFQFALFSIWVLSPWLRYIMTVEWQWCYGQSSVLYLVIRIPMGMFWTGFTKCYFFLNFFHNYCFFQIMLSAMVPSPGPFQGWYDGFAWLLWRWDYITTCIYITHFMIWLYCIDLESRGFVIASMHLFPSFGFHRRLVKWRLTKMEHIWAPVNLLLQGCLFGTQIHVLWMPLYSLSTTFAFDVELWGLFKL